MEFPNTKVTGFVLKVLAILGMTANHFAHVFMDMLPWQVAVGLYSFGGLTFPIMAYLIVEGYLHTSNLRRYISRLGIFAVVSQLPYWLCMGFPRIDSDGLLVLNLNVFFTLLIGLCLLWTWDHARNQLIRFVCVILGVGLSYFCDWALQGPLIILLFYILRGRGRAGILITMILPYAMTLYPTLIRLPGALDAGFDIGMNAVFFDIATDMTVLDVSGHPLALHKNLILYASNIGYVVIGFTLSTIAICLYNGKRGRPMKWLFYAYYPAHLLIIWVIHASLTSSWIV